MKYKIDHIVYGVNNLSEAVAYFKSAYGIEAIMGGKHEHQGTHNAIFNLGDHCYFEIIAKDHNNELSKSDVWMGLDFLKEPKVTRWAIKSIDIQREQAISKEYNLDMGNLRQGARTKLDGSIMKWDLLMPLSSPEVELMPFFIDWSEDTAHPTLDLPVAATLQKIEFYHPEPQIYTSVLHELNIDVNIIPNSIVQIKVTIQGPKGVFTI